MERILPKLFSENDFKNTICLKSNFAAFNSWNFLFPIAISIFTDSYEFSLTSSYIYMLPDWTQEFQQYYDSGTFLAYSSQIKSTVFHFEQGWHPGNDWEISFN